MNQNIKRGLVAVGILALTGAANAAVSADVTAAITQAGTDGLAVVGALSVAGAGVFLTRKVLSRLGVTL